MNNERIEVVVNGVEKTFLGVEIIKEVQRILEKYMHLPKNNGVFISTIYLDYNDYLPEEAILEITKDEDPEEAFYEYVGDWMMDSISYEESYVLECIENNWDNDKFGEYYAYYNEFVQEVVYSREIIDFVFPYDHLLKQEVCVNLLVDTGDGDYDFTLNNFLSYNAQEEEYKEIEKESSILWLVKQQGYTEEDLIEAIENDTYNRFLKTVVEELENPTSSMNALSFFVSMTLGEYIRFIKEGETITVDTSTSCGLVDHWSGAGSLLSIELAKPVTLTKDILEPHVDGGRGYGVDSIYGMLSSFWGSTVTNITYK